MSGIGINDMPVLDIHYPDEHGHIHIVFRIVAHMCVYKITDGCRGGLPAGNVSEEFYNGSHI